MSIKPDRNGAINLAGIALIGLSLASLAGCQEESHSAETAGESIDRGIDNTGDAINDGMDNASDAFDDAFDDAGDGIDGTNDPMSPAAP